VIQATALLALVTSVSAECPNACSGHGTCQPKDMCSCYKNWQGNDCSEATCYFGLAHVDTPKGNLDGDVNGHIDGTLNLEGSTVYPTGTYELYPLQLVAEEAHYYMECSNKGICDRETGLCQCFDGYEGTACKRAACPNDCSGHGTCESIKELGLLDWKLRPQYTGFGVSPYTLWDADVGMGCLCDPQFGGADCSLRQCKYGVDPLYSSEDKGTVLIDFTDASAASLGGSFKLGFYRHNSTGESTGELFTMQTAISPVTYVSGSAVAKCDALIAALYAAENENGKLVDPTILAGLECKNEDTATAGNGVRYRLSFPRSPAFLSTLFFYTNTVTGADHPSIAYYPSTTSIANAVYEEILVFVKSTSGAAGGDYRLKFYDVFGEDYVTEPITATELAANANEWNNEDVCNGVVSKLVKLPNGVISDVRCTASTLSGGALIRLNFYKNPGVLKPVSVYESNLKSGTTVTIGSGASRGEFVDNLANKVTDSNGVEIQITRAESGENQIILASTVVNFVAAGTMVKVLDKHLISDAPATTTVSLKWMYTGISITASTRGVNTLFYSSDDWTLQTVTITVFHIGDTSFEPSADLSGTLSKGDTIFVQNQYFTIQFATPNTPWTVYVDRPFGGEQVQPLHDIGAPADMTAGTDFYLLTNVDDNGKYEYVSPCSNRGTCDETTGLCQCFKGYSNDNCDTQNALFA